MATMVYQYPKCSTCRQALAWLDEHEVPYEKTDLVASPPSLKTLKEMHQRSGLPVTKFFNTAGESYRKGNFRARLAGMSNAEALEALAADGKLIKRPIVDTGKSLLLGFDEKAYASHFRRKR